MKNKINENFEMRNGDINEKLINIKESISGK